MDELIEKGIIPPNNYLELYKLAKTDEVEHLKLHRQYAQQYFVRIIALIGISIGFYFQFADDKSRDFLLLILIGTSISNIALAFIGILQCFRFYVRFLESITIQIKLEDKLGFSASKDHQFTTFKQDNSYFPGRWEDGREKYRNRKAQDFVNKKKWRGANLLVLLTFSILILMNAVIGVTSIYLNFSK